MPRNKKKTEADIEKVLELLLPTRITTLEELDQCYATLGTKLRLNSDDLALQQLYENVKKVRSAVKYGWYKTLKANLTAEEAAGIEGWRSNMKLDEVKNLLRRRDFSTVCQRFNCPEKKNKDPGTSLPQQVIVHVVEPAATAPVPQLSLKQDAKLGELSERQHNAGQAEEAEAEKSERDDDDQQPSAFDCKNIPIADQSTPSTDEEDEEDDGISVTAPGIQQPVREEEQEAAAALAASFKENLNQLKPPQLELAAAAKRAVKQLMGEYEKEDWARYDSYWKSWSRALTMPSFPRPFSQSLPRTSSVASSGGHPLHHAIRTAFATEATSSVGNAAHAPIVAFIYAWTTRCAVLELNSIPVCTASSRQTWTTKWSSRAISMKTTTTLTMSILFCLCQSKIGARLLVTIP